MFRNVNGDLVPSKPGSLTFPVCDAVWGDGPTDMDHATAIGHFILAGVLARVVIINGVHDAQIPNQSIQNLKEQSGGVSLPIIFKGRRESIGEK